MLIMDTGVPSGELTWMAGKILHKWMISQQNGGFSITMLVHQRVYGCEALGIVGV